MTRIIFDGFDLYPSASASGIVSRGWLNEGQSFGTGGGGDAIAASSRFGTGNMFRFSLGIVANVYMTTALSNLSRVIFGMGLQASSSTLTSISKQLFFSLVDSGSFQACGTIETDGSIAIRRGDSSGTIVAQTSPGVLPQGLWRWCEFDITINDTTGAVQIWVEGTSVVNVTSLDTKATSNAFATHFRIGGAPTGGASPGTGAMDDVYALDPASGSAPWNARLGDSRAYLMTPSGAGSLTQLTPDSGSNWQRVGSIDDDSSYNATSTVGNADLYAQGNLPGGFLGTVWSLFHLNRWRKDDAGAHTAAQLLKSSSTTNQGSNITLSSTYTEQGSFFDTDPATSAAWTASAVNAVETGAKMTA